MGTSTAIWDAHQDAITALMLWPRFAPLAPCPEEGKGRPASPSGCALTPSGAPWVCAALGALSPGDARGGGGGEGAEGADPPAGAAPPPLRDAKRDARGTIPAAPSWAR